jgi:predicted DsbA family dithiol-disulfide isomerase
MSPTPLTFYFDPVCPWAWRTSLWAREVQRQQPLDITWKVFSLGIANGRSDPNWRNYLRALVLARREGGNDAIDRLYLAMGQAVHDRREDIKKPQVLEAVLEGAGFDRALYSRALDDPSTEEEVTSEHNEAKDRFEAFGVPWLVLDGRDFGFYGPVISEVPQGEDALELWRHTAWLFTQPYLYEIKRERG